LDSSRFDALVARLERESAAEPGRYQIKVALLAALGFAILALILGFAGFTILLMAALVGLVLFGGAKFVFLALKLGKFLLVLALPLWFLLKSALTAFFTRLPKPDGIELGREQAPALFAALDDMRVRMRGPRFHHVLLVDEMNAGVVQRPLLGLFGLPRNYLLIGLPMLESLAPDEAMAVLAHEYGHLAGSHGRFGAYIYRLRNTWSTIEDSAGQWRGIGGRALGRLVSWYAPYFNAYTFALARANEYQADAAAAELVTPAVAAAALKRVNIASARYQRFVDGACACVRDAPAPPADLSERWAQAATHAPPDPEARNWLRESLERGKRHDDTHPPLRDRLSALPGASAALEDPPAPLTGASAALAWLGACAGELRDRLQRDWRARAEGPWREQHEALQAKLRRLAQLRAAPARAVDEEVLRLRLQVELEPDADHLPELCAFNAATPGHAMTLYLEGDLRLARGEAEGLERLEQAMAADRDAIEPACARAVVFLQERGDQAGAQRYLERLQAQRAWELVRAHEAANLDAGHALAPADLDPDTLAAVREQLRANADGIARAWIARRVLPSDPAFKIYVLGIELDRWARFLSRGPRIGAALARLDWPIPVHFCTLDGAHKALKPKLEALSGASVAV
jgi:Zn-dependent protease with chaperone function